MKDLQTVMAGMVDEGIHFTIRDGRFRAVAAAGTMTEEHKRFLAAHKEVALQWTANTVLDMPLSRFAGAGLLVTVESDLLGRYYLASDADAAARAPEGAPVYLPSEIAVAAELSPETLRRVHRLKAKSGGEILELADAEGNET